MVISSKTLSIIGLLIAFLIVSVDQLTKAWALNSFFAPPKVIEIFSWFNLVPVWNSGISFGMLAGYSEAMPTIISALTIVISIILLVWLMTATSVFLKLALSFILGGAIGNIIDRIQYGAVIDFIDVHFFWF